MKAGVSMIAVSLFLLGASLKEQLIDTSWVVRDGGRKDFYVAVWMLFVGVRSCTRRKAGNGRR